MATIREIPSGYWQAIIRKKGYPAKSKSFEKRKDAENWATVTESKMIVGDYIDKTAAQATTLYDALDRYKKEISVHKKSKIQEEYRIDGLKKTFIAKFTLASLKSTDLAKYRDERLKEVSAATTKLDLALISNLFTVARKEWNLGVANPVADIRLPKVANARDRRFKNGEEKKVMDALDNCKNKHVKPLVQLALETGCRMGELRTLLWENIDLKKAIATAKGTKYKDEDRVIPLSKAAVAIFKLIPKDEDSVSVFDTTKDAVSHAFTNACERAEVLNFHFHDLRHEAVSRLFEKGLSIMEVASISGHKTLSMLKRYTHLNAQNLAKKLG
jgi:integrase